MYAAALDSAQKHLIKPIRVIPGMDEPVTIGNVRFREVHEGEIKSWYSVRLRVD
jgi:hypothetical protein